MLGGGPVQHREVQHHESSQFQQLFPMIEYLEGGVESGFKKVQRGVYETRLLHVKGSRNLRVMSVSLSADSLNEGDVFILDQGSTLVQWNGRESSKKERSKALQVCNTIKDDERGGKCEVTVCLQGEEPEDFWQALGGRPAEIGEATSDDDPKMAGKGAARLVRVSDESGTIELTEVSVGGLERSMLDTNDVFIVDLHTDIFVWVGKKATRQERQKSMCYGIEFSADGERPPWTRVTKVTEGAEPPLFTHNFSSWATQSVVDFSAHNGANVAKARTSLSAAELATSSRRKSVKLLQEAQVARQSVVDLGGSITAWRIEKFKEVRVPAEKYGEFYEGDSYILRHDYVIDRKEMHVIYFWLGRTSSVDEKGAAALIATRMDDELGGAAKQVRIVMGKEPDDFLILFKGRML
eukprot:5824570-Prymnesium_polylepis.1